MSHRYTDIPVRQEKQRAKKSPWLYTFEQTGECYYLAEEIDRVIAVSSCVYLLAWSTELSTTETIMATSS